MVQPPKPIRVRKDPTKPFDPGRVFYRVALREHLTAGNPQELVALAKSLKEIKAEYGDLNKVIETVEAAAKKAGG